MGTIRTKLKQDGTETYHAEVRRGGHKLYMSFRTKTQAKDWIRKMETEILDGRAIVSSKALKYTLGELIDRFLEWQQSRGNHDRKQHAQLKWWKNELGHLPLAKISSSLLANTRDKLFSSPTQDNQQRTGATVNRYMAALSSALTVAVNEWELIPINPMRKVKKYPESSGREIHLSPEQIKRLLHECDLSTSPYLKHAVIIAIASGMRYTELMSLRWSDIRFGDKLIILSKTKNGDRRGISITDSMQTALDELKSRGYKSDYVFPALSGRSKLPWGNITQAFKIAKQKAGLNELGLTFHDLRHTHASILINSGANLFEIGCQLGHRSPVTTKRYSHLTKQHKEEVVNRDRGPESILKAIADEKLKKND